MGDKGVPDIDGLLIPVPLTAGVATGLVEAEGDLRAFALSSRSFKRVDTSFLTPSNAFNIDADPMANAELTASLPDANC